MFILLHSGNNEQPVIFDKYELAALHVDLSITDLKHVSQLYMVFLSQISNILSQIQNVCLITIYMVFLSQI